MKVLNVYWDSIPSKDHNHILAVLPVGDYIASLPFRDAENHPVFKVAVLGNLKANMIFNPSDVSVCETEVLVFRRVSARKDNGERSYIWRKE